MPKSKVARIGLKKVRGGTMITGYSHSPRGTKYIYETDVVLREGKTKKEFRDAVAAAIEAMVNSPI